ncbi:MAG: hypothetical protein JO176_05810 [Acidimicrobiia bacterium]|nr:hypothetical protein [Acidimicrobiia bacterium]
MEVDLHSPRVMQGIAAAVVLLGFVADFRVVVVLALLGVLATFVLVEQMHRMTWATEAGLLVLSAILFLAGHSGFAWLLAMIAAGVAALAAAADIWIAPDRA